MYLIPTTDVETHLVKPLELICNSLPGSTLNLEAVPRPGSMHPLPARPHDACRRPYRKHRLTVIGDLNMD